MHASTFHNVEVKELVSYLSTKTPIARNNPTHLIQTLFRSAHFCKENNITRNVWKVVEAAIRTYYVNNLENSRNNNCAQNQVLEALLETVGKPIVDSVLEQYVTNSEDGKLPYFNAPLTCWGALQVWWYSCTKKKKKYWSY